jgi:hypothetical protein
MEHAMPTGNGGALIRRKPEIALDIAAIPA